MSETVHIVVGDNIAFDPPAEAEVHFDQEALVNLLSQAAVNLQPKYEGSWSARVSVTTATSPPRMSARVKLWKESI